MSDKVTVLLTKILGLGQTTNLLFFFYLYKIVLGSQKKRKCLTVESTHLFKTPQDTGPLYVPPPRVCVFPHDVPSSL